MSRHARLWGLAWSRAKVAGFEAGEKPISAEELALIVLALSDATARPVTLADLIPTDARITLSDRAEASGDALRKVYAAASLDDTDLDDLTGPGLLATVGAKVFPDSPPDVAERKFAALWQRADATRKRVAEFMPPDATKGQRDDLLTGVPGEAEKNAAKKLGEDPAVVLALSRLIWGHPLAEERDRLLDQRADAGAEPDRLRGIRGRITRDLVSQLAERIAEHPRTEPASNNLGDQQ